ncbi:MAG TPA: thioredoxin domain-containing protein [Flavisolibacter sp.]|nr:thioredoxin domain-containing protein [Flavisolibacter sp.]
MATLKPPVNENDHQTGNRRAAVTLVEYGDYQCPHCGHAYPLLKHLVKEKGDAVRFVFRNFPLQDVHPMALPSALAAEAAGKQGKFWEMHDLIFEHQNELSQHVLLDFAYTLDLDAKKFMHDWESEAILARVDNDFESGVRSGVNGTPGFFVNGEMLDSYDGSYASLLRAIEMRNNLSV